MTEMTARSTERRRNTRINLELPVILENATAVTRDVSPTGVFFWKRGVFAYGDSIRFSIERTIDAGTVMQKCRGAVVRTEPRGYDVGVAVNFIESAMEPVPGQPSANAPATEPVPNHVTAPVVAHPRPSTDTTKRNDDVPASVNEAVNRSSLPLQAEAIERREALQEQVKPRGDDAGSAASIIESAMESLPSQANEAMLLGASPVPPPDILQQDNHVPAPVKEAVKRWSSQLRAMALEAREELQGQEVLEWDIPLTNGKATPHSPRVTICSVTVAGSASNVLRVLAHNSMGGGSLQAWYRLTSNGEAGAGKSAVAQGVGGTVFANRPEPHDERGLRIELEIQIVPASAHEGIRGKTPVPKILIRMAAVAGDDSHQEPGNSRCPPKSYRDPTEAFEAFLALAVESAILMNLDSH